jgi:pyruvate dehydrogenase E2 component (dihydrolipoamide acetyltransferase)
MTDKDPLGEASMSVLEVRVPDIGDFKDVPIIEIQVKAGDVVRVDDPLVTLESDKASMEVPAPSEGRVVQVLVKIGDKVSKGSPIVKLEAGAQPVSAPSVLAQQEPELERTRNQHGGEKTAASNATTGALPAPLAADFGGVYASPSVRRLARELDIDLNKVKGSGDKGRITKDDIRAALRGPSGTGPGAAGTGIPDIPAQDFSRYGPVEIKVLSRIRKLSGPFLHRSWLNVPHVTHTDEADISDLEPYRKTLDGAAKERGYRVTMLAFLMKASVVALKEHPEFNSSLSPGKDSLIVKKYYHLGVAVDTPDGLVVPVLQNVDRKGILELSQELGAVSKKMREGKIAPGDIQGASFTISSLGGIGGTNFTPIVNAPEVAILGVVRSAMKPVWDGKAFQPRLMLPLCVSYDHRVIDGALAARFTRRLANILEDVRQLVL